MDKINLYEKLLSVRHGLNVRKYRKVSLQINYREGLIETYATRLKQANEKREKLIKGYVDKDILPHQKRLDGITENSEKISVKLNAFDKFYYWKKRHYVTSLKRSLPNQSIDEKVLLFDQDIATKRQLFLQALTVKYPDRALTKEEIHTHKRSIEAINHRYAKQLERIRAYYDKQKQAFEQFKVKNERYLNIKREQCAHLKQIIHLHEEKTSQQEMIDLKNIDDVLSRMKNTNKDGKTREKLTHKLIYLRSKQAMHDHAHIHLSINQLKMYFGGIKAVNDLSFDVKKGEIFGLIGPNGAGKTTVFNCITQFYKATSGSILFRNKENDIVNLNDRKTHDMIGEGIARSFQNVELIWELSVIDNLLVASHTMLLTNYIEHMLHTPKMLREESVIRAKGMKILTELGIQDYAYRSPYGLPYGILKKIELARTLMTDPTLIILDEPAAGLNDSETLDLANVIKQINKNLGITIFLVEHDMGLVMSICDTVCAISFGKMLSIGTPQEIQQSAVVRNAYLGDDSNA